jgi:hypothetical protein
VGKTLKKTARQIRENKAKQRTTRMEYMARLTHTISLPKQCPPTTLQKIGLEQHKADITHRPNDQFYQTTLQQIGLERIKPIKVDHLPAVQSSSRTNRLLPWFKLTGYAALAYGVFITASYAGLDDQLSKAEELVFGTGSKIALGASGIGGGTLAIYKGNTMQGVAVIGATLLIGLTMSLIKDGSILKGFQ